MPRLREIGTNLFTPMHREQETIIRSRSFVFSATSMQRYLRSCQKSAQWRTKTNNWLENITPRTMSRVDKIHYEN